jgi:uncharacterized protein YndB with AHSA1/START domain
MPTQKVFKQRVRARMTKTGESYTAARHQLLRKATEPMIADDMAPANGTAPPGPALSSPPDVPTGTIPDVALLVADAAMVRATGKGHAEWFALLDEWGATGHTHTEIARWLSETQGTPGWWTQNITVSYERARGMRARHEMADGFTISVTRTVAADAERALAAFTHEHVRAQWLPGNLVRPRPTRAALTARFDWAEPPSRVVVNVVPKANGKSMVAVAHEQLPDAEQGERMKTAWRAWLADLKSLIERN